jgi:ERCC4-type nuclease
VRIGHTAKVTSAVVSYTLDVLLSSSLHDTATVFQADMEKLRQERNQNPSKTQKNKLNRRMKLLSESFKQAKKESVEALMANVNVIFSTLSG